VKDDVDSVIKLYDDLSAFIASEGPFDGIMGFSEGAGVAASLLAAQEKSRATQGESKFQFKCGIFFCGAEAFDAPSLQSGKLRKLESSTDGQIITLPTAHIWAKEDTLHPKFGQSLRKVCMDAVAEEFLHDLGHAIPGAQSRSGVLEATRAIGRTIERAEQM
jgi:predicted esterase